MMELSNICLLLDLAFFKRGSKLCSLCFPSFYRVGGIIPPHKISAITELWGTFDVFTCIMNI